MKTKLSALQGGGKKVFFFLNTGDKVVATISSVQGDVVVVKVEQIFCTNGGLPSNELKELSISISSVVAAGEF